MASLFGLVTELLRFYSVARQRASEPSDPSSRFTAGWNLDTFLPPLVESGFRAGGLQVSHGVDTISPPQSATAKSK
jgi:hypothetical protein